MSEPTLTPEQQARADAINKRIAELKQYEGRWFVRNDGKGLPIHVNKYAGMFQDDQRRMVYAFELEITGHAKWNGGATDFLKEHHEIPAPMAAPKPNDLPI